MRGVRGGGGGRVGGGAGGRGWVRHQSRMKNNLLRSEMRQLRGKDQKEKKKEKRRKKPTLQEPHT